MIDGSFRENTGKRDSPKPVGPRPMLVCFFLLSPLFLFTNNTYWKRVFVMFVYCVFC